MAKYLVNAAVTIEVEAASERGAAARTFSLKGENVRVGSIRPTSINAPGDEIDNYYEVVGRCEWCGKILMDWDGYYYDSDAVTVCSRCAASGESEAE